MSELVINKLPGRTYEWLGVNETVLSDYSELKKNPAAVYEVSEGAQETQAAYIHCACREDAEDEIVIRAGKGSAKTFVWDCVPETRDAIRSRCSVRLELESEIGRAHV